MQTVHTEITSGNAYYNETQSILLSTTISVHKTVIPPGTHSIYSSITVAFVSKKGGCHLNSSIQDPRENKELDVPRHKNDGGRTDRKREKSSLQHCKEHTIHPCRISKSNGSQIFFSCASEFKVKAMHYVC